jgi:phosphoglycolate phosphatase-like HAD superfamily hydrolase
MVSAIISDIDGTIIDSVDPHIKAWQRAFENFGKEVSYELIRREIGKGANDMLPTFFTKEELHWFRRDLENYRSELFKREYLPNVKAFPCVRELFERIKRDRKKIVLASTAKGEEINIYKEIAGVDGLIDCSVGSEEVEESKPHKDICAMALRKLGNIDPQEVISIGDTAYDVEASRKISVRAIGLLCGGGNRRELNRAGCIAIYKHPADLLESYDSSPLYSHRLVTSMILTLRN